MSFIKSYFAPKSKGGADGKKAKGVEPVSAATPSMLMSGIPAQPSPAASRPASLYPSSLYPSGDFRNAPANLVDIKADVMCSWLYQQQLERQYATGILPGEGVVLKKGRNNYACCPPHLQDMQYSLYDMAMELNVRVRFVPSRPYCPANPAASVP